MVVSYYHFYMRASYCSQQQGNTRLLHSSLLFPPYLSCTCNILQGLCYVIYCKVYVFAVHIYFFQNNTSSVTYILVRASIFLILSKLHSIQRSDTHYGNRSERTGVSAMWILPNGVTPVSSILLQIGCEHLMTVHH